jgi:hydrogenase maturation protein HypF
MLPYTPLHHLLMRRVGSPLVATSGNLSEEPICTDEREALERLGGVADLFLVHDRPIARHVDDSVVRVVMGRELVLRRARGYAPLPISVDGSGPHVLAVGAQAKNAVAACTGSEVTLSQHVGDLDTAPAVDAFRRAVEDLSALYAVRPAAVACDAHPDYHSTAYARASGARVVRVQHHFAHVVSCMAENDLAGPVLGVAWDGTGYGLDGTIWGGEFLRATRATFRRVAHLRRFRLPGGEKAIVEPRRAALGLLYELLGDAAFDRGDLPPVRAFRPEEIRVLRTMLQRSVNAPATSSAGRLFDAVGALLGLHQRVSFEGQAALALESALDGAATEEAYPFALGPGGARDLAMTADESPSVIDWAPLVRGVLDDVGAHRPAGTVSAKFHNGLVEVIVAVARVAGEEDVVLTGGCFQNRYLAERAIRRLRAEGFRPHWHRRVPPGDGGIALGQAVAAAASLEGR